MAQLCPNLCNPMDCSLPGSSVHGIFQARVLEWVAISFSRGSSRPRDRAWVFFIAGRCFTICAAREALFHIKGRLLSGLLLIEWLEKDTGSSRVHHHTHLVLEAVGPCSLGCPILEPTRCCLNSRDLGNRLCGSVSPPAKH